LRRCIYLARCISTIFNTGGLDCVAFDTILVLNLITLLRSILLSSRSRDSGESIQQKDVACNCGSNATRIKVVRTVEHKIMVVLLRIVKPSIDFLSLSNVAVEFSQSKCWFFYKLNARFSFLELGSSRIRSSASRRFECATFSFIW
jgi:hypothetical protein